MPTFNLEITKMVVTEVVAETFQDACALLVEGKSNSNVDELFERAEPVKIVNLESTQVYRASGASSEAPTSVNIIALRCEDDNRIRDTLIAYPETMTKAQANVFVCQAVDDVKRADPEEHTFDDLVVALASHGLKVVDCPDADVAW